MHILMNLNYFDANFIQRYFAQKNSKFFSASGK